LRFRGTCYRAHDPRWSFTPLSGAGAALHGGRFNPRGTEALYLSLSILTAVKEANQGFAFKIAPCVLCSYEVDCEDIADLSSEESRAFHSVDFDELACAWFADASVGAEPSSWQVARRLIEAGHAGVLVPSFAPGAEEEDRNMVLWRWSDRLPHRVAVFDPDGRLPKDQRSWT
jgi:RES domain-containing protein